MHPHHFAQNTLLDLGGQLRHKLEAVNHKQQKALDVLQEIEYTQDELWGAWKDQLWMQSKDLPCE